MARVLWVAIVFGLVLASAKARASQSPAGFSVSLAAEYRSGPYQRVFGAFVALSIPFDRWAAPRLVESVPALAEEPPKPGPRPAPLPALKREPVAPFLTARLARGAVRHALSSAGYLSVRSRLGSLASRARSSSVLPELGLRTLRSTGQTLRLTPTGDDPYRYTQAGTSELVLEARLTWRLDRLVFAGEELTLERLHHEWDLAERRLIDTVLQRLLLWQRGRVRSADPDLDPEQRQSAEIEALGAAIELDVLTDGWFSQAIGESGGQGVADAGESLQVEVNTPRHAR